MNHNMKTYLYASLALLGLTLSACERSGRYEPGPEPASDSIEAFFLSSNPSEYILGTDATSITLEVGRMKSDFAASVPVTVEFQDASFEIPATVEFAAGEATAEFTINFRDMPTKVEQQFIVRIAGDNANPYAIHDGSELYSGKVLVSEWKKVVSGALFWFSTILQAQVTSDIYWLDGFNRFRIENFLGTGFDLSYSINNSEFDPEDISTWTGEFSPLDHYAEEATDDDYKYWSLRDASGNYFEWTPDGAPDAVTGLFVYRTDYYSAITMDGSTSPDAYFTTYMNTASGKYDGWEYIYAYWTESDVIKP